MAVMTYREALNLALREEMQRDPRVFVIGEEVGLYEGAYKVTQGLLKACGPKRVVDTPIAESGFTGVGIGAAMVGLRPVVEMMTFNFAMLALDQIVNTAAKMNYMSGGQFNIPIVVRGPGGPAHQLAAQHSQSMEVYFYHVPGLKVVRPSTPMDAKGLLKAAIRDDNPVVFIGSVRKTHRAVVVEAGAGFAGMGSEIAAFIMEQAFDDLDAPVERVTGANAPMPYARGLERAKTPSKERIMEAIRRVCYAERS